MKRLDEIKRGLGKNAQLSRMAASRLKGGASNGNGNAYGHDNGRGNAYGRSRRNGNGNGPETPPPPPDMPGGFG